jgi:hypothetical protein
MFTDLPGHNPIREIVQPVSGEDLNSARSARRTGISSTWLIGPLSLVQPFSSRIDYLLTPVMLIPLKNRFWVKKKRMRHGRMMMTEAAIQSCH